MAIDLTGPDMIVIEGHLESITFRNETTRYTIARFNTVTAARPVTVVGFLSSAAAGQALKLTGKWVTHPRYGQQFEISACELMIPASIEGIHGYLCSGIIRGIGPAIVSRIMAHFGEDTMDVLTHQPERLMEVSGIGKAKAASIAEQWRDHCTVSDIMALLSRYGLKGSYGPKIYGIYGTRSVEILSKNPYRLAEDMAGSGFFIADTIARQTGAVADEHERARACIEHILRDGASAGHVFLFLDQIIRKMASLFEIDADMALDALHALADEDRIIIETIAGPENAPGVETRGVFLHTLHHAEKQIAHRMTAMLNIAMDPLPVNQEGLTSLIESRFLLRLSEGQRKALQTVLSSRVSVITGGPGTGKTTLIKSIAAAFTDMGKRVCLAAPTGRAARRISEVTLRQAHTIHKLLGFNFETGDFIRNTDDPIDADVFIVDEASMIDTALMHHLLCAIRLNARLIMVGDMFQLPPIGPGNILSDIITSDTIPVCHLNEVFRQAGMSPIVTNAHLIREGLDPELTTIDNNHDGLSEFIFIEADTPGKIAKEIVKLCSKVLPDVYGLKSAQDIQVLSPVHKGEAGTINLNSLLQAALNPGGAFIPGIAHRFKSGDRVMHVKNNYQKEVFNGDTGIITGVETSEKLITVDFQGRLVTYGPEDIEELSLGYAITIHKSQGSEYPTIIMPLTTQHYMMLQRNLVYTAVTRAKRIVFMVGTRKALTVALRNNKPQQRLTSLSARLQAACGHTVYAMP
jgi:exodeoxyribonuclease V alpha subunit